MSEKLSVNILMLRGPRNTVGHSRWRFFVRSHFLRAPIDAISASGGVGVLDGMGGRDALHGPLTDQPPRTI